MMLSDDGQFDECSSDIDEAIAIFMEHSDTTPSTNKCLCDTCWSVKAYHAHLIPRFTYKLANEFPDNARRKDTEASYNAYDKKADKYDSGNVDKFKERQLLVALVNVALSFGTYVSGDVWFWIFDHARMRMSTMLTRYFGNILGGIHVPNPNSALIMRDNDMSGYKSLVNKGVQLFSAMSFEFTDRVKKLLRDGLISQSDLPRYAFVWYDACSTVKKDDFRCLKDLFKLNVFRTTGPSILAVTFSWRHGSNGRGITVANLRKRMSGRLNQFAINNGFGLLSMDKFGHNNSINKKGGVYTQIFCVIPDGWRDAGGDTVALRQQLDATHVVYYNKPHCYVCEDGGSLICCDKCPNSAHRECAGNDGSGTYVCGKCDLSFLQKFKDSIAVNAPVAVPEKDAEDPHQVSLCAVDAMPQVPQYKYQLNIGGHLAKKYHKAGHACSAVKATWTKFCNNNSKDDFQFIESSASSGSACGFCFPGQVRCSTPSKPVVSGKKRSRRSRTPGIGMVTITTPTGKKIKINDVKPVSKNGQLFIKKTDIAHQVSGSGTPEARAYGLLYRKGLHTLDMLNLGNDWLKFKEK